MRKNPFSKGFSSIIGINSFIGSRLCIFLVIWQIIVTEGADIMNITPETYGRMSRRASPKTNSRVNVSMAFLTGGCICVLGELIRRLFEYYGLGSEQASAWTSVLLVGISAVLTGLGWYQKLAKHAGAGTLVPITGFSNAVCSSAIEARSEGFILGVGTKIFTIAGPVILYGCAASVVYGIIYYITG